MTKILLVVFILFISLVSSRSSADEPTYTAKTWDEALALVPCDHVKKNPDGTWKVSGTLVIDKDRFVDPTVAEKDRAEIVRKHCGCRAGSLATMGVGC